MNPGNHLQTLISKALKGKKGGLQERSDSSYASSSDAEGKVAREWATLRTRLSASDSKRLADDFTSGVRVKDLVVKYGISRNRVHAHLVKHGVVRRPTPLTSEEIDRAVLLYRAGMTLLEVAAELNSNTRAVTLALESKGVPRRPRGVRVARDWAKLGSPISHA